MQEGVTGLGEGFPRVLADLCFVFIGVYVIVSCPFSALSEIKLACAAVPFSLEYRMHGKYTMLCCGAVEHDAERPLPVAAGRAGRGVLSYVCLLRAAVLFTLNGRPRLGSQRAIIFFSWCLRFGQFDLKSGLLSVEKDRANRIVFPVCVE